eukprot:UN23137
MGCENFRCPKGVDLFFTHYTTTKLVDIHEPRVKCTWLFMMTGVLFFCYLRRYAKIDIAKYIHFSLEFRSTFFLPKF